MAGLANQIEKDILDFYFGAKPSLTKPTAQALALFTVAPTDTTPGTEVVAASYQRQACVCDAAVGNPAVSSPANDVIFPVATEDWGDIVAVGFMDGVIAGAGTMITWTMLTALGDPGTLAPVSIIAGQQFQMPANELIFKAD